VHLGGPQIVKAAIKEIVDRETLGGAEMHSTVSGVSDHFARDRGGGHRQDARHRWRAESGAENPRRIARVSAPSIRLGPKSPASSAPT